MLGALFDWLPMAKLLATVRTLQPNKLQPTKVLFGKQEYTVTGS